MILVGLHEAPRELSEGMALWAFGLYMGRRHVSRHVKHTRMLTEEVHHLAHTGEPHPRVSARLARGHGHTPTLEDR